MTTTIIDFVQKHGALNTAVLVFFAAFIAWGMLKRALKVAVILCFVLVGYVGYLYFSGQPIPRAHDLVAQGQTAVRQADETVGRPIKRIEHRGAKLLADNGDKVLDDLRVRQAKRADTTTAADPPREGLHRP
jgi:hypothetical protein